MAEEPKKPFKLSPTPMTAVFMLAFAILIDALQFFAGLALTVVVGIGVAIAWMLGLLAYVVLWIWFKLSDNNTHNHFALMKILAFYGSLIFFELLPGMDFFPGTTFGVLSRILISWAGDAKANKLAEQEAEGKELSARKQRTVDNRMSYEARQKGAQSEEEVRAGLRQKAIADAPKKDQKEIARRQDRTKAERAALDVVGLVAPEARFAAEAVKTGQKSLDALRAHQDRKRKGAANPPEAANDNRPYASDRSEAA